MSIIEPLLFNSLQANHLDVSSEARHLLVQYLHLLQLWNRTYNLTRITDPKEMVNLHIIDSLLIAPFIQGRRCLDVGSGAGLPGIPLAILNSQQQWVLLDKNSKKTRFMTQAVAELKLANVQVVHSRSEDFHTPLGFDSIVSRALGSISQFGQTTLHLLDAKGVMIAMKGKYPQTELADLPQGLRVFQVQAIPIAGIAVERHVVLMQKIN